MSKRTQLLHKLKHVYSHNTKLVLDVENKDIELIIEGLEKQVAKKVIVSPYNNMKYCPICEVSVTGMYFDYCVECGQKLDWSEVE